MFCRLLAFQAVKYNCLLAYFNLSLTLLLEIVNLFWEDLNLTNHLFDHKKSLPGNQGRLKPKSKIFCGIGR